MTSARFRIGGVPYGLGAPLLAGLHDDPAVELVRAPPAVLIRCLREGSLDAALVSSIEAIRRDGYRAVDRLCIASDGAVRSVRAFRRRPAAAIRSVALTDESETSVALLRILLDGPLRGAADCSFERVASTRHPDALPHDVVLLIGDDGLHADPGARESIDLGECWTAWTELPFVYALWLIHPDADAEALARRLIRAGTSLEPGPTAEPGARVHYRLETRERLGLERFWSEAAARG
ncbi:MAG: MqnA/MqnD/SBP family protein, partial [Planctomycetota bacterium]